MAYVSVISLKHTIKRLLNSSHISILPPSRGTIQSAYEEVLSLQEVLEKIDNNISSSSSSKKLYALDEQIRETVRKLEDLLETHVSNQLHSQSEGSIDYSSSFSLNLEELNHDIDSFTYSAYMLKDGYINELEKNEDNVEDYGDSGSRSQRFSVGESNKTVGLSDQAREIIDRLIMGDDDVISLFGMAGIGKTTLANEIYEDPSILNHFDCRAWVKVGPNYQLEKILECILAQVNPEVNDIESSHKNLSDFLNSKTNLIVLDDIWSSQCMFKFVDVLLRHGNNRGRLLVTTRLKKVAIRSRFLLDVRLLNKDESWNLLREKVFPQGSESMLKKVWR